MKRIHPVKIDDAKFYETIWGEEYNARPYFDAVRMRALLRNAKDGDSIMDIGAGVFGACQYIIEDNYLQNCKLSAYDQSNKAKEIVSKIAPQINYIIGECESLQLQDNEYDIVIAGEIIEHMEDPASFAKELMRIVKPGGWVSLSTVDTNSENAKKREYPEHIWEYTKEDLIGFFENFGETEYEIVGDYHFIYCQKK